MNRKIEKEHVIHQRIMRRTSSKSGKTIFRKKRIGDLVATVENEKIMLGYSLCHKRDMYDFVDGEHRPGFGVHTALNRAMKWKDSPTIAIPPSIKRDVKKFMVRCEKYFAKNQKVAFPTIITMDIVDKSGYDSACDY